MLDCTKPCEDKYDPYIYESHPCENDKKYKESVIALQSLISNGSDTPVDSNDGGSSLRLMLPIAPKVNRIFDDNSFPHKPPFLACITNIPSDANEDDIHNLFGSIAIVSLQLPKKCSETGSASGLGYVEFENLTDLINVLSLPDQFIKGQQIRINLSNENEQQGNHQSNNFRGDDMDFSQDRNNYDRGYNRKRRGERAQENSAPGSWRTEGRSILNDSATDRKERYRNQKNYCGRNRGINKVSDQERPKLNLKPRTLPLPEIDFKPEPDVEDPIDKNIRPKKSEIFGAATPVDTASRELEIENRLAQSQKEDELKNNCKQQEVIFKKRTTSRKKIVKEKTNVAISWRRSDEPVQKERDLQEEMMKGRRKEHRLQPR